MIEPLDLNGPLTGGTVVLEASAGTGKTYALSHRVLREVGENGRAIDQILVVTFTRAAAAEIRRRIRTRLEEASTVLAYRLANDNKPASDPTLDELISRWAASPQGVEVLLNLLQAIDRIDLAPITTIHGFIQRLIQDNGTLLGLDPQRRLREGGRSLLQELVNDWRRSVLSPAPAPWQAWVQSHSDLSLEGLMKLAQLVDDDRDMLLPEPLDTGASAVDGWQQRHERFERLLASDGISTGEAMQQLCKGTGNKSPAGALLGKTKLAQLPDLIAIARDRNDIKTYRKLVQAFSTSQLKRVLADPDQAPSSGLHGAAEQLCFEPIEQLLTDLVHALRQGAWQRRQLKQEMSFGDLLERVDPARLSPPVMAGLKQWRQQQLSCCLIDEFQDTDPIQWRLFAALFDGEAPLTLIGDPKQAIYRFRGGDIRTYRSAVSTPERQRFSLDTNRRSDPALLSVLNRLFAGEGSFGSPTIDYRMVQAPEHASPSRLRCADGSPAPPVRMRWLGEADGGKPLKLGELRDSLPQRVCDDLQRTLTSGMELQQGDGWRALHPGDLAVLVGRNREAVALQRELQRRGIPARIGRGGDLWQSPEAASLSLWLESSERQGDRRAAAALALSSVGGFLAAELSGWSPSDWGAWLQQLEQARQRYALVGPLAALEVVQTAGPGLPRLRGQANGEQRLSDRRQMAELLQQSWQDQGRPSAARLLHWLTEQQLFGGEGEDAQQRIVASESMVTLTTLHSSKGLEFPLVWCPTLWEVDGGVDAEAPFRAWDPSQQRRVLELSRRSGSSPRAERLMEARLEGWQERLRLGYVALTRAKHQLCLDWGRIKDSGASLPAWLLHPELRQQEAEQPWQAIADHISRASDLRQALQHRCNELGIHLEDLNPEAPPAYRPAANTQPLAAAAAMIPPRRPISSWGRWSYSRLHDQSQTLSPSAREEEGFDPDRESSPEDPGGAEDPCWRELPGGASFGTLVHAILEQLDFEADLTSPEVRQLVRDEVARSGLDPQLSSSLLGAIEVLLQRPLGGPLGDCRLDQIASGDTLRELPFDIPLSGFAASPSSDVLGEALEQLAAHHDPVVQSYARERLQQRQAQLSSGFLNGVIDLIIRRPSRDGTQHWVVLDWKTNRLVRPINDLMAAKDYWLQAQLYRQAVQRWLHWRLGEQTPVRIDAVMLFTRSGEGAWLLDETGQP